jgi:hypothetical protein
VPPPCLQASTDTTRSMLRDSFLSGLRTMRKALARTLRPKTMHGHTLSASLLGTSKPVASLCPAGETSHRFRVATKVIPYSCMSMGCAVHVLGTLVQEYVNAINAGRVPTVAAGWVAVQRLLRQRISVSSSLLSCPALL